MLKNIKYNNLILLTVFITVAIVITFISIFSSFSEKIEETRLNQFKIQQKQIALQTASTLKDFIEFLKSELLTLSLSSPKDGHYKLDKKSFSSFTKGLIDSVVSIVRIDSSGNVLERSSEYLDYNYIELSNYFIPTLSQDAIFIEKTIDNQNIVFIIVPINDNPEFIIAAIDMNLIDELYLSQTYFESNGYVWLLNKQGDMLSKPKKNWITLNQGENYFEWVKTTYPENSNDINKIIAENSGSLDEDWSPYEKTTTWFSHIYLGSGYDWIIGIVTPLSEFEKDILPLQHKMLYLFISTMFLFSIFFIFILIILKSKEKTQKQLNEAKITLKKLGIKPISESPDKIIPHIELQDNNIYLTRNNSVFEIFINLLSETYLGLIISRKSPVILNEQYGIEKTPIIRLRKPNDKNDKLSITNTEKLIEIITEFMNENKKSVIVIDRLDYIITLNGFEKTLEFIYAIKDSLINESIVLCSLTPASVNDKQLSLLLNEVTDITNLLENEELKLPKDIYKILEFIAKENENNKKIVFKDVSDTFNITKPTTKKKLNILENLELIRIEKFGRVKSLNITKKGIKTIK